ncbi:hypothetical protein HDU98_003227, partial [Podochytrium sp. JEL0797]
DFSVLVNSTFTFGLIDDLPAQLENIYQYINYYYPGRQNMFLDRTIQGANWKVGLNAFGFQGKEQLIVVYMNTDSVQVQLGKQSTSTGYVITGIIVAFVIVGGLFSILIGRQLGVVSRQIQLLRDLKFKEVLGGGTEVKDRSFIYELAELQKCFYQMVVKFSELIKVSGTLRDPTNLSGMGAAPNVLRGMTTSQHHTGAGSAVPRKPAAAGVSAIASVTPAVAPTPTLQSASESERKSTPGPVVPLQTPVFWNSPAAKNLMPGESS